MGIWVPEPPGWAQMGPKNINSVDFDFYGFNLWSTVIQNALYQLYGNLELLGRDICVLKFEENP